MTTFCNQCGENKFTCLGCNSTLRFDEYVDLINNIPCNFNDKIEFGCDCCDHHYLCKLCFILNPNDLYWKELFQKSSEYNHTWECQRDSKK